MAYHLRPGLHFCDTGRHIVFLDLVRDRYFSIPQDWNVAFRSAILGPTGVDHGDIAMRRLMQAHILVEVSASMPARRICPLASPQRALARNDVGKANPWLGLDAFRHQLWAELLLRRRGLLFVVEHLRAAVGKAPPNTVPSTWRDVERVVAGFSASALLMGSADNCLSRSIALMRMLRRRRFDAHFVIGVTASPFAAHAWVQIADLVVFDDHDRVRRFAPILTI